MALAQGQGPGRVSPLRERAARPGAGQRLEAVRHRPGPRVPGMAQALRHLAQGARIPGQGGSGREQVGADSNAPGSMGQSVARFWRTRSRLTSRMRFVVVAASLASVWDRGPQRPGLRRPSFVQDSIAPIPVHQSTSDRQPTTSSVNPRQNMFSSGAKHQHDPTQDPADPASEEQPRDVEMAGSPSKGPDDPSAEANAIDKPRVSGLRFEQPRQSLFDPGGDRGVGGTESARPAAGPGPAGCPGPFPGGRSLTANDQVTGIVPRSRLAWMSMGQSNSGAESSRSLVGWAGSVAASGSCIQANVRTAPDLGIGEHGITDAHLAMRSRDQERHGHADEGEIRG